ncbi:MAG: DNA replication and repair protein recF [uncultured bacterium]|nr:MAG: DNA replication and repair protein recF [uncultured bacterium]
MTMHAKVGMNYKLSYDKSVISEARLEQYRDEEVAAATTLVGPHRDDFVFLIGESRKTRDLSRFGSRGEQRMAILWLKLCELAFVEAKTSEKPTLLLDDIFSELDHDHRAIVMEIVNNQQTLITTADPHFVENFKVSEKIKL